MYSKKNLFAAVVLGLSMSLTSVAPAMASADDVSVQVNVQQNVKGSVNWEKGADGYSKKNPVYGQRYDVADEAISNSGRKNSLIKTDDKLVQV